MVIWLEDLLDEQDDAEGGPVPEREPAPVPERDPRDGAEDPPTRTAAAGAARPRSREDRDEDQTVDVTERGPDPAASEAAHADDDGWALLDIEAARFTRH